MRPMNIVTRLRYESYLFLFSLINAAAVANEHSNVKSLKWPKLKL